MHIYSEDVLCQDENVDQARRTVRSRKQNPTVRRQRDFSNDWKRKSLDDSGVI